MFERHRRTEGKGGGRTFAPPLLVYFVRDFIKNTLFSSIFAPPFSLSLALSPLSFSVRPCWATSDFNSISDSIHFVRPSTRRLITVNLLSSHIITIDSPFCTSVMKLSSPIAYRSLEHLFLLTLHLMNKNNSNFLKAGE